MDYLGFIQSVLHFNYIHFRSGLFNFNGGYDVVLTKVNEVMGGRGWVPRSWTHAQ